MAIPGLVIAGTFSGVGKTTIAVGIMAALRRRGLSVQPFKVGPDYIDPSHHTVAAGRPSRNLDSWMLPARALLELFDRACSGADVAVIEGVMGLFDGHGGSDEAGSTAEVAKLLDVPVVVILDAARMARSAAAMAFGYARFDPNLRVAGFILNGIGGERHFEMVREAIEGSGAGRVFGYLPRDAALDLPERHLGLIPTEEERLTPAYLDRLVALIEEHVDLDGLLRASEAARSEKREARSEEREAKGKKSLPLPLGDLARSRGLGGSERPAEADRQPALHQAGGDPRGFRNPAGLGPRLAGETPALPALARSLAPSLPLPHPSLFPAEPLPRRAVIAVARDEAFNFYYQDNLELLEAYGAELAFFSPLRDASIPEGAGALYVGGGFPEMHAAALAANGSMLASIRRAVAGGMPVYVECGGLMYLSRGIVDEEGKGYPMVGAVPGWCSMRGKRLSLGYVEVTSLVPTPLGPAGTEARGHEFHYSLWDGESAVEAAYGIAGTPRRTEGFARGNLLASFVHLHFGANPALAPGFVESAAAYGRV